MVAFLELQAQVDHGLFEGDDLLLQLVDIDRRAEAGLAPGLLPEGFGEPLLELMDAAAEPAGAFVGVGQVGLQGCLVTVDPWGSPAGGVVFAVWSCSSRSRCR